MNQTAPADVMAAVDLGSNSFHMVVARLQHGQLTIIDRLREMIRLASGLDAAGTLDAESQARAISCLQRFGQRIAAIDADQVRVVGTNTFRQVARGDGFFRAVEAALGQPVDVISGIEEARLVYLGVSHSLPVAGATLVVDIGGGSTELIAGKGFEPERLESLSMGCVGMSEKFFADGELSAPAFARARLAARLELRPIKNLFRGWGWEQAVGSSGTIRAAARITQALGLRDQGLDGAVLETIIDRMIQIKKLSRLDLPGLSSQRAPVFPGGVAILVEVLEALQIDQLEVSDGALREGLLYDMLGRLRREDARERTVRAVKSRYHVDMEQALRVAKTAANLLAAVEQPWGLAQDGYRKALHWACELHEIGLDIAHDKYHQHGAYLLENADLPGFVRQEQLLLATLVGRHRHKLVDHGYRSLSESLREPAAKLVVLLRLAVLLHRSRASTELPQLELQAGERSLQIGFPGRWLENNPLTLADITQEKSVLAAVGFQLAMRSTDQGISAS